MPRRVAYSTLNASTIDILNVIRQNALYEYQNEVPEVTQATDIPRVGEVICGSPAFQNQFLNALINRIALVRVSSALFNNPYTDLKKGYLEFGETIENVFVDIAKVVAYSAEKAHARELKRTIPDVKSAFHVMNWRVMYPVTIQESDLRRAFTSLNGVTDLIQNIINQIFTGANYDEYLLFKYLIIKAVSHGKMKPVSIGTGTDFDEAGANYRGYSNLFTFMRDDMTEANVMNTTPKDRQAIFMDAKYNAQYDVNVLASAFNMDKATYQGNLYLIDDFTTFDNKRWATIRAESDGIEEVTEAELALMANVKAILIDKDWFQVYDNETTMRETQVASGLYWNYFYHTWKTVSHSPFHNAVVFVTSEATVTDPATLTATIESKDVSDSATVFTLSADSDTATLAPNSVRFVQTEQMVKDGIAIQPYGAVIIPKSKVATNIKLQAKCGNTTYDAGTNITGASEQGATVTLSPAGE